MLAIIIEPGHGLKGCKQWLYADNDIDAMYTKHAGKKALFYGHTLAPKVLPRAHLLTKKGDLILKSIRNPTRLLKRSMRSYKRGMVTNTPLSSYACGLR